MADVSLTFQNSRPNTIKTGPSSDALSTHKDGTDPNPPIISLNASHVTAVLFQSAHHVIQDSTVHWVLGKLALDPSSLLPPMKTQRAVDGAGYRGFADDRKGSEPNRKGEDSKSRPEFTVPTTRSPAITMTSKDGTEGTGEVYVQCDVTDPGEWRQLQILFHDAGNSPAVHLLELTPFAEPRFLQNSRMTSQVRVVAKMTSEWLEVSLHIIKPICNSSGTYSCWANTTLSDKLMSVTNLVVHSRPSNPVLRLPTDVIEGHALPEPIRCHAYLGNPPGSLKLFASGGQSWKELTEADGLTLTYNKQGCGLAGELTMTSPPGVNGTEVVCVVDNADVDRRGVVMETRAILLEIPLSVCEGQGHLSKVAHPYSSCSKYLVCDGYYVYTALCPALHCFVPSAGLCVPHTLGNTPSSAPSDTYNIQDDFR
ncbi:uncharacterized protein [Littorina saxatilis]